MKVVLIITIVLSAVLPLIGLLRLFLDAYSKQPSPAEMRAEAEANPRVFDDVVDSFILNTRADQKRGVWVDFVLIGVGIILGATASILSLP